MCRMLDLGEIPLVNDLCPSAKKYPAQVYRCRFCGLRQLGVIVEPELVFPSTYPYVSGSTRALATNFAQLADRVTSLCGGVGRVVDIGSNDGTLLKAFRALGWAVQGVEPTDTAQLAQRDGVATLQAPFTLSTSDRIKPADVVTASNVFAHVDDIHGFMRGVARLLKYDGLFVSESHHWVDLVKDCQFDAVYHEHLRYYTLGSLQYLLGAHGFNIVRYEATRVHGGSIRVYASRGPADPGPFPVEEDDAHFQLRVDRARSEIHALVPPDAWGIGAPSRGSTLVSVAGLQLAAVAELSSSPKIGGFMPGTSIPIVDEAAFFAQQPKYALLLSWHIAEELIPKLKARGYKGKFIIPLPEPRVVE